MKYRLKILSLFVLTIILILVGAACNNNDSEENAENILEITQSEIVIEKGESYTIPLKLIGVEEVLWAVDDTTIVSVVDGVATGLAEGETIITVKSGDLTSACTVIVIDSTIMHRVEASSIVVIKGEEQEYSPLIYCNGKEVVADVNYLFDDPTIASYSNGKIKGLKTGSTNLTIVANYNGKTAYKVVSIGVVDDVYFDVSNTDVALTLVDNETEQLSFEVYEGTNIGHGELVWYSNNEDIATVENGLITAKGRGVTEIIAQYESDLGKSYDFVIDVEVKAKQINKNETIKYVLSNTPFSYELDEEVFGAILEGQNVQATLNGKKISIDKSQFGLVGRETEIIFSTKKIDYVYNFKILNGIITTSKDFVEMWDKAEPLIEGNNTFGGYWELGNDIDVGDQDKLAFWTNLFAEDSGYRFQYNLKNRAFGFLGVFDGCGYEISGVRQSVWNNSLFGEIGRTGVVKNLAVKFHPESQAKASALLAFSLSGTIENIYVSGLIASGQDDNNPQSGLIYRIQSGAKINNVISNARSSSWGSTTVAGLGFMYINGVEGFDVSGITNCFVISPTNDMKNMFAHRGLEGACSALEDTSWFETQNVGFYKGYTQTAADSSFKLSNHDLTSFEESDMWIVENGTITYNDK